MRCNGCGIDNPEENSYCGKCGESLGAQQQTGLVKTARRTSGIAIAALLSGIAGWLFLYVVVAGSLPIFYLPVLFLPVLISVIAAIVCGVMARRETGRNPNLKGRGMATAGMILGIVELLLIIFVVVSTLLFMGNYPGY